MNNIQIIALSVIIVGTMYLSYLEIKKIYSKIDNIERAISKINVEKFTNPIADYNSLREEIDSIKNKLENYIETDTDDSDDNDIPLNNENINLLESQYEQCNFLEQSFNEQDESVNDLESLTQESVNVDCEEELEVEANTILLEPMTDLSESDPKATDCKSPTCLGFERIVSQNFSNKLW